MKLSTNDSVADINYMPPARYSQTPIGFLLYKDL